MTDAIRIRPAEARDFAAVARMIAQLADHIHPGLVPKATAEDIGRYGPGGLGLFEILMAERAGKTVGFCLYTMLFSGWRGRPGIYVNDLFVDSTERGNGIGERLLDAMLSREAAKDVAYVRLDVEKDNLGAKRFYERLGFAADDHGHVMMRELSGKLEFDRQNS